MTPEEIQKTIRDILAVQKETQNLVKSNAKSIEALSSNLLHLSDEVRMTQRQLRDAVRRIDETGASIRDLQADTRELILENQRILRYLERRQAEGGA